MARVRPDSPPAEDAAAALAQLVAETRPPDIDARTREAVRLDLLDTLGCAIAGRNALGVGEAADVVGEWGGSALSSVWGRGCSLPPTSAAFANAMAAHALDFDDMHPGVTHTGVSVIPAALAAAEARGVTDLDEVITAVALGTEVTDRMALAVSDGPGVTGWLLTPLCGYFGAAAAAARMGGLDAEQTRHALGFAYVQASGNGQSTLDGAVAKRMQPGFAARGGVLAAALAGRGLTGPVDSLEGIRGFYRVYHRGRYEPGVLREGVGEYLVNRATYKPYPCCGWTHAAIDCARLLRARGVTSREVDAVEVGVNAQSYNSTGTPLPRRYRPRTVVDAQFSIPYTFATALVTGSVTLSDFTPAALGRPEVLDLAARVQASMDAGLDATHGRDLSPARVVARLKSGGRVEVEVLEPDGRAGRPLGRDRLIEKFRSCCAFGGRTGEYAGRLAGVILDGGRGAVPPLCGLLRSIP